MFGPIRGFPSIFVIFYFGDMILVGDLSRFRLDKRLGLLEGGILVNFRFKSRLIWCFPLTIFLLMRKLQTSTIRYPPRSSQHSIKVVCVLAELEIQWGIVTSLEPIIPSTIVSPAPIFLAASIDHRKFELYFVHIPDDVWWLIHLDYRSD